MKYLLIFTAFILLSSCNKSENKSNFSTTADSTAATNYEFENGYPNDETADRLVKELRFQQAVQSYLWSLPAINMYSMKIGSEKTFGAGYNILPIWAGRMNAKTKVTTPNADVIYAMGYVNLKEDGPIVVEVPPMMQGIFDDFWQRPLVCKSDGKTFLGDVGLAGPDGGKGGKFLLIPPDFKGDIPKGYYVFNSKTYNVFVFWRAFFKDPKQLEEPVNNIKKTKIYPLGKEASAKAMQFPNASEKKANLLFPTDGTYFDYLKKFIDEEYVDPADLDMRGLLAGIGIAKGKAFNPDEENKIMLDNAAKTAFKTAKALNFKSIPKLGTIYKDRQWLNIFIGGSPYFQASKTYTDFDLRIPFFANAYSTSAGMTVDMVDKGAKYPSTFKDADGSYIVGDNKYVLHLPAKIPAKIFWSVSIYDAVTASGVDNGQPFFTINSMDKPEQNSDGSYDIYLSPENPQKKNWIKTNHGEGYLVCLRLYGPAQSYFDGTWKPDDVKKIN